MLNIELITDKQLYALNQNSLLKGDIRKLITDEYEKRAFADEYIYTLNTELDHLLPRKAGLSLRGKILTVLTAYFFPLSAIGLIYFSKGSQIMQKQYWELFIVSYMAWSIIIIALSIYLR